MKTKLKTLEGVEIEKVTDQQLDEFVKRRKIDITGCNSRDDVIAAIELHNEALKPPLQKPSRRSRRERIVAGAEVTGEPLAAVQRVWAKFATNIPFAAQSSGVHELDEKQRENAEDHGVPDGCYRVVGADWALRFEGGCFVEAVKASTMKPDGYREVPQAARIG